MAFIYLSGGNVINVSGTRGGDREPPLQPVA